MDLIQDDFDPNLNVAVWASVTGGVATNGGQGFRGSQALWFGAGGARSATSIALDVSRGGTIEFALRAGSESLDGNLFWNNSEAGESVVLEYSKDGGNSWVAIQTFNTVYPSLSNWTVFSIAIPAGAASPNTQFRWRQLANSGAGTDAWALDDVRVQGVAPAPPDAPPFIISSPSSSTSIAVLWIEADRAMSYVLERRQGTNSWVPLTTRTVSMTYYTDVTVLPATAYSYRVKAVNAGGVSPYSSTTTSTAWSQIEEWLFLNYGTPDALSDGGMKTAGADGTRPLVRFAFGLTASEPARTLIPGQSASGFPAIWLDSARDRLCVEFVRRKNSTNPGIAYTVLFGSSLIDWTPGGAQVSAVSIDSIWERVRYEDTITASQAPAQCA